MKPSEFMKYIGKSVVSRIETEGLRLYREPRSWCRDNSHNHPLRYGVGKRYTFHTRLPYGNIGVLWSVEKRFTAPKFIGDINRLDELVIPDRGVIGSFSAPYHFGFETDDFSRVTNLVGYLEDCKIAVGQDIEQAITNLLDYVCARARPD